MNDENNFKIDESNITYPRIPPLFTGIASAIAIFFIYQLSGSIIFLAIFGMDVVNIEKFTSFDINLFRLLTIGGQVLFMLFPTLVITKFVYKDVTSILRIKKIKIYEIGLFFIGFVILTPILQYIMAFQTQLVDYLAKISPSFNSIKVFLDSMNDSLDNIYKKVMIANNALDFIGIIVFAALTPAICEEVLFRGLVQRSFEYRFKALTAIFFTSFIFSVYHFNPYGLIPLILLSMYFGYSVYLTESIFISAILHFSNNFFSVAVMNIFKGELEKESDVFTQGSLTYDIFIFVFLVIIFILLMRYIFNYYKTKNQYKEAQNDMS